MTENVLIRRGTKIKSILCEKGFFDFQLINGFRSNFICYGETKTFLGTDRIVRVILHLLSSKTD